MHGMLFNFIYWFNVILSFSDGIAQKSLFLHTFSRDLSIFSVLIEWRQFKQEKSSSCFEVIPCNNAGNFFYCKDNAILLFLLLESLTKLSVFHNWN